MSTLARTRQNETVPHPGHNIPHRMDIFVTVQNWRPSTNLESFSSADAARCHALVMLPRHQPLFIWPREDRLTSARQRWTRALLPRDSRPCDCERMLWASMCEKKSASVKVILCYEVIIYIYISRTVVNLFFLREEGMPSEKGEKNI